ncbi:acyloxyacyl hydrolase [Taibaiella chishuiensis]|uniref:Lipid A 3-O-deacylase PagL n=1 Tax=Taibaiella chishuiensis TaxID=1434707 RepID=A0A2P8CVL4_9BACT|nr:acyloxyacyl hydrolase [Taibaiella chishuiensis]PSK89013.1 lipid A 3-O-deacylase PagL [Taibaiella chishuiensis]
MAQEQQSWKGFGIEGNVMMGKMIKHTARFTGTLPERSYSAELNFVKQCYGQKDWQQRRHNPQLGVGLYYTNYNKNDVYGQVFGIFPNIQFPLVHGKNIEWTLRLGMGVCYVTKPYQRTPVANTENTVIGGHWNNLSPFSTDLRWHISDQWDLQAGLNFSHVSNASFQQPNLGINMWGGHIGLRYFPVTSRPDPIRRPLEPLKNRWLLQGRASIAFVESPPADGPLYPVYMGALYVSKRYWSKNKVYGGADIYYNTRMYSLLKSIEHFRGSEGAQSTQVAVFLGNEFLVGRIGLIAQAGYYLHKMDDQKSDFYQKIGGNLYLVQREKGLLKELFFSAILKTHTTTAELFEMGIGIGI